MGRKLDESILCFGAGVILKFLDALKQEIPGVRNAHDIEYIHRMRVASRRLRNAFNLFGNFLPAKRLPAWQNQIKQVTQALGAARDTDVQIELVKDFYSSLKISNQKAGIHRLIVRLNQRRTRLQAPVTRALDDLESSQTLKEMGQRLAILAGPQDQAAPFSPALYEHSFGVISSRLDEFLSFEAFVEQPECKDELHAMRIAAKHLRYTLEVFAPLYQDGLKSMIQLMRRLQDNLGEIHDCDVWIEYLPDFIEKERARTIKHYGNSRAMNRLVPGLQFFLENRKEDRDLRYQEFVTLWQSLRKQQTWDKLRDIIQVPETMDLELPVEPSTPD
jgi:CHAD domain-containing protein